MVRELRLGNCDVFPGGHGIQDAKDHAGTHPTSAPAGVGISFCFPTVANAIMSSIPIQEAGSPPEPTARYASSAASSASPSWPPCSPTTAATTTQTRSCTGSHPQSGSPPDSRRSGSPPQHSPVDGANPHKIHPARSRSQKPTRPRGEHQQRVGASSQRAHRRHTHERSCRVREPNVHRTLLDSFG